MVHDCFWGGGFVEVKVKVEGVPWSGVVPVYVMPG